MLKRVDKPGVNLPRQHVLDASDVMQFSGRDANETDGDPGTSQF